MQIVCIPVTMMKENTYFYFDKDTKVGVVIDPGGESQKLALFIKDNSLDIKAILLTHGHFDHILAADKIKALTGAPIIAHSAEAEVLRSGSLNQSLRMHGRPFSIEADVLLEDGGVFEFGGNKLRVLHTPGHTVGGVSYYSEQDGVVFVGDTLFAGSVGRSDFEGSSTESLLRSINEQLMALPDDTRVYPGHGPATTIAAERASNPFIRD